MSYKGNQVSHRTKAAQQLILHNDVSPTLKGFFTYIDGIVHLAFIDPHQHGHEDLYNQLAGYGLYIEVLSPLISS